METLANKQEDDKNSLKSLEQRLTAKRTKWIPGSTKHRITNFILKGDVETALKWTGLSYTGRYNLWNFLGPAKDELKMWGRDEVYSGDMKSMTVLDQFLMTLLILRKDWNYKDVATVFDLDEQIVSSTFKTWVQFMYFKFKENQDFFFTKKEDIDKSKLPKCFQNPKEFKEVNCIIDCTEIFIQSSKSFEQQSNTFSNYKHHTTVKVLIGCHPNGAAVFCSPLFEGGTSDKQAVLKSGFLDFIQPGNSVMADRGFQDLKEEFLDKGATLITPPSMRGKNFLDLSDEFKTRSTASARIHIERFNQRMKTFLFVSGTVPQCKLNILPQAVYVCCFLANYSPNLVN